MEKTKNYDMFKFRQDNRLKIERTHVEKLKMSIQSKNMLELRPIIVNEEMEIIDGQHRFIAAKELGVDIYYTIQKNLRNNDIILMNISRAWRPSDYLNYYVRNHYEEYIKLDNFVKNNNLQLRIALNICIGNAKYNYNEFKDGKFLFDDNAVDQNTQLCWETIRYIEKMNGTSPYTQTTKFWKAMLRMQIHPNFDEKTWKKNLSKLIGKMGVRVTCEDYCKMLMTIYNYHTTKRIDLLNEV